MVNPLNTKTVDTTICANELPFSFLGHTFTAAGTIIDTVASAIGCDTIRTINVTVNSLNTLTVNETICANQLPYSFLGHTFTGAGTIIDTVSSATSCDTIRTINLAVNPLNTKTSDTTICANQLPFSIFGHTFMGSGSIIDTASSLTSCDTIRTINVLVVNETYYTKLDSICSEALPYYWNGNAYTAGGTYELRYKNQFGCDSVHALILNVVQPKSSIKYDSVYTSNLPYVFGGQNFYSSGTYPIHFTSVSGCDSVATLMLIVKSTPSFAVNDPLPVCAPSTIDLTAPQITAGSNSRLALTYWYDSLAANSIVDPSKISETGIYYIKFIDPTDSVFNSIKAVNVVIAHGVKGIRYTTVVPQPNEPTPLSARNIGTSFSWYPGLGINATNISNPEFNFNREVQYEITILADSGCVVVDTLLVKPATLILPLMGPSIYVPKAWTPNYDGRNDKLYPMMVSMTDLKSFRIFNRWGELVFETKVMGAGWDGIYKGQLQMMDVYTWMVEAIGSDGRVYKKTGSSVLMK